MTICPFDPSHIQCIGFDADDTLWQNEVFYLHTERAFKDLLRDVMEHACDLAVPLLVDCKCGKT